MAGYVTQHGAFAQVGGVLHRLPDTPQPVCEWVADLTPCRHCEAEMCDGSYADWIEAMAALERNPDPHGDLSWRLNESLSY